MSSSSTNDNLTQMYQDSLAKQKALKLDIDNFNKQNDTNERKVFYELGNVENVLFYNMLIKILYFVILGIYIMVRVFNNLTQILNPFLWITLITYISIPFVVKYPIGWVFDWINQTKLVKNGANSDERPASACFLLNQDTDLEEPPDEGTGTGDTTVPAPLLVPKCYIRFEGEQCKKHPEAGWAEWRLQTKFDDCLECDGTTQVGCDAIKNQWSTYCGTNTFDIFTTDSMPGQNVCIVGTGRPR